MQALQWLTAPGKGEEPCLALHLLEGALASWRCQQPEGIILEGLWEDLRRALGAREVEQGIEDLLGRGLLEEVPGLPGPSLRLRPDQRGVVSARLGQLRREMTWETAGEPVSGETYLKGLVRYLRQAGEPCSAGQGPEGEVSLSVHGERYEIWRTFSPYWLPLAAQQARREETFLLAFGPFAGQDWGGLYPYYAWEEFRDTAGLYDPWHQEKLSLCRGRLPVYLDWFQRDRYRGRFSIPQTFCDVLHDLGLMRYDDER